jgi:multidrug resistance efflux pump
MKKILLLTLVFIFTASFSLAQFPGESYKQVTGVVKKLKKGNSPQIVVTGDDGEEMTLVIDPEATYYDAEFYPVTLDEVKVKKRVNIRYDANDDGTNVATWFNILD